MRTLSALQYRTKTDLVPYIGLGALAGLGGGLVFGLMMAMMEFLPMVAMLVGQDSALVGFLVHMAISAVLGAGFGFLFGAASTRPADGVAWGVLYGVIWWVVGALIIMPVGLGMPVQLVSVEGITGAFPSLAGHLVFGVVTALIFVALGRFGPAPQK
jgi:uncharacterized membrane protein YagU involved in acid resistance